MQSVDKESIRSYDNLSTNKKGKSVMKNIKRIIALAIVAMILVAIAIIPASAAETRAVACSCGGVYTFDRSSPISSWTSTGTQRSCTHFEYGRDIQKSRTVRKYYACDECPKEYYNDVTEYKWVCEGHG